MTEFIKQWLHVHRVAEVLVEQATAASTLYRHMLMARHLVEDSENMLEQVSMAKYERVQQLEETLANVQVTHHLSLG